MKNRLGTLSVGISWLAVASLAAAAVKTDYPPFVTTKRLYAKNDLRGKSAPALVVAKWLSGKAPSTKGKVVLIDFWATWCPPCRETIPELGRWAKAHPNDLVVIGISNEDAAVVRKFMKTTPMPYHVAIDGKSKMSGEVGVEGIPHILVISPDGIVRWQGFPLDDADKLTDTKLNQIISAARHK